MNITNAESNGALRNRFIEPPFTIIDARTGDWRKRKNKWLELGIQSELGRDVKCIIGADTGLDYMPAMKSGTSIFDPALCELLYFWFASEIKKEYKCNKCNKIYAEGDIQKKS
jgi:hypothetical protein